MIAPVPVHCFSITFTKLQYFPSGFQLPYQYRVMISLSHDNQPDVIEVFNSTFRYLDDLLNIDNSYFKGMVNQIHPPELQLYEDNSSDTEAAFLNLHLFISNVFVSSKNYNKREDFDFDIVNFLCKMFR